ncbi:hypothetical protein IEN85_23165 [Pelagicoccus sp. NFK12]|uniref:Lipoprotein n=1 Tax=Pelagicoccus enzymogenes TaxID=2773457 RepID=A0A927FDI7_9BACT|nr:hypothetical protein [Pelagicoccus enzymogenes]MBD5782419.1 hypothetical protein [Pelagicoccus enzymogenes]
MRPPLCFLLPLAALLLTACNTPASLALREELKADAQWPSVKAFAQAELRKQEGSLSWSFALSAEDNNSLVPVEKDGDIWTVVAAADYPDNRYGLVVDIRLREDGTILAYQNRLKRQMEEAD